MPPSVKFVIVREGGLVTPLIVVSKIPVRQDMTAINNFYLVAGVSGDQILKN